MPGLFCFKREDTAHILALLKTKACFVFAYIFMTGFPTGFIYCFSSQEQSAEQSTFRMCQCNCIVHLHETFIVCCAGMNRFSTKNRPV